MFIFIPIFMSFANIFFAQNNEIASQKQREKLISYAKTFIGTPYLYGGSTKKGMDCSGFIFTSVKDSLNMTVPRTVAQLYNSTQSIKTQDLQEGDIVFFKTTASNSVSHAGIYMGRNQFIHSASDGPNTGVIVSSLNESYWKKTYFSAGRFLNVSLQLAQQNKNAEENQNKSTVPKNTHVGFWGGIGWSLFSSSVVKFDFKNAQGFVLVDINDFVFSAGIQYKSIPSVFSIPLQIYFPLASGFKFYVGQAFSFDNIITFPFTLGLSWQPKLFTSAAGTLYFVQNFSYTVSDIASPNFSAPSSGFGFSSGIRFMLPL